VLSLEIVELIWAKGSEDFQDFPAVRPNALVALLKPAESPNPGLESVLSPKEEGFFREKETEATASPGPGESILPRAHYAPDAARLGLAFVYPVVAAFLDVNLL
jgi:hypothetical protein